MIEERYETRGEKETGRLEAFSNESRADSYTRGVADMAGLQHIRVTHLERNGYHLYRIYGSQGRVAYEQINQAFLDAHLLTAAELLELAAYVEEHREQLELEAREDQGRIAEDQV